PTVVSQEGANQSVSGTCTDIAGNSASATLTGINIDRTPPAVTVGAGVASLWPPNGSVVPDTIFGRIADALSGVDLSSLRFQVIDSYGLVQPSGLVTVGSDGRFSFSVGLQ